MESVVNIADPHCPMDHKLDEVATTELFSSILAEILTSCYTYSSRKHVLE